VYINAVPQEYPYAYPSNADPFNADDPDNEESLLPPWSDLRHANNTTKNETHDTANPPLLSILPTTNMPCDPATSEITLAPSHNMSDEPPLHEHSLQHYLEPTPGNLDAAFADMQMGGCETYGEDHGPPSKPTRKSRRHHTNKSSLGVHRYNAIDLTTDDDDDDDVDVEPIPSNYIDLTTGDYATRILSAVGPFDDGSGWQQEWLRQMDEEKKRIDDEFSTHRAYFKNPFPIARIRYVIEGLQIAAEWHGEFTSELIEYSEGMADVMEEMKRGGFNFATLLTWLRGHNDSTGRC